MRVPPCLIAVLAFLPPAALGRALPATTWLPAGGPRTFIGLENEKKSPELLWKEVPGAAKYRVELASDVAFKTIVSTQEIAAGAKPRATFPQLSPGRYWARVTALDKSGTAGIPVKPRILDVYRVSSEDAKVYGNGFKGAAPTHLQIEGPNPQVWVDGAPAPLPVTLKRAGDRVVKVMPKDRPAAVRVLHVVVKPPKAGAPPAGSSDLTPLVDHEPVEPAASPMAEAATPPANSPAEMKKPASTSHARVPAPIAAKVTPPPVSPASPLLPTPVEVPPPAVTTAPTKTVEAPPAAASPAPETSSTVQSAQPPPSPYVSLHELLSEAASGALTEPTAVITPAISFQLHGAFDALTGGAGLGRGGVSARFPVGDHAEIKAIAEGGLALLHPDRAPNVPVSAGVAAKYLANVGGLSLGGAVEEIFSSGAGASIRPSLLAGLKRGMITLSTSHGFALALGSGAIGYDGAVQLWVTPMEWLAVTAQIEALAGPGSGAAGFAPAWAAGLRVRGGAFEAELSGHGGLGDTGAATWGAIGARIAVSYRR